MLLRIVHHVWQSSLFAGFVALLTLALKGNRAEVRYRLWQAASLKFLVPFSLLMAAGRVWEWKTAVAVASPLSAAIDRVTEPLASPLAGWPGAASGANWTLWSWNMATWNASIWPALLATIWLCGFAAVLYRWWTRWQSVRASLVNATRLPIASPVPVMSTPSRLEPGVFGIFRPVLLLPDGIAARLTPAQMQAVLAHEFCHVRRRDNLAAAIQMFIEAVFWFHPMAWWIGSRMVEERERACDEDVLRAGSAPEVYVEGILSVCRHYLESPLACASGVTGADLKKRVAAIMAGTALAKLSPAKRLLLAAAGAAMVAGPFVYGMIPQPQLRFDVAVIKPAKNEGGRGSLEILPGGGIRAGGWTTKQFVAFAYGVQENQVAGGPAWMTADFYSILAKPEQGDGTDERVKTVAPGTPGWARLQERMRTLLEERFQLTIRRDKKEVPGYALVPAKGGVKLKPSEYVGPANTMRSQGAINARGGSMEMLATVLSNFLGRSVANRTGLSETYDYKLEYAQTDPNAEPSDSNAASIFTALQEQLGLKLEAAKVSNDVIVITRLEKPSAN